MEQSAITTEKARLRALAAAQRDQLHGRDEASAAIATRVLGLPEFRAAAAIHCFLPIRSEVDTRPIIVAALAAGKRVAIPITVAGGPLEHSWITSLDPAQFERGVFGTPRPRVIEPARPGEWDLTIVPLLAFDRSCTRLGYGKGHYDRLLAEADGANVGVAFTGQEQPAIPRALHDFPLDLIATEHELIRRP